MTRSKVFLTIAVLLVFVSMLGAWTGNDMAETRYVNPMLLSTYANENIYYTRRDLVGPIMTAGECPYFYPVSGLTNACGAVAGAEIVAFYDKYFTDLIPDWTPHYNSGKYRWQDSTYVPAVMRELYTLMRTNVDGAGVSESDFLNGLKSYINGKGHQVSYDNAKSGNKVNYEKCLDAVDNNKVVVLFTSATRVCNIVDNFDYDTIVPTNISDAHIMVIFGYFEVYYYDFTGMFRYDRYLKVAMGMNGYDSMFFKADNTDVQAAYVVNIQ